MGSEKGGNLLDGGIRITGSDVNDKIPDLAKEVVLIGVPVAVGPVWVRIDNGDTCEAGCRFDCGKRNRIAHKLSVIVLDEWRADEVRSRWKVDESWGYGTGVAAFTAAVAITDGGVDVCGVVGLTVTSRTIVLYIAEYFVRRVAKRSSTLALDVGKPVR